MKKLLLGAMALLPLCVSAQSLIVNLKSGEIMKVPVSEIQSLSFKESPAGEAVPISVFKDPILQAAVAKAVFGDDAEGKTEFTQEELASVKELRLNYSDVASLEGIGYLTELTGLYISGCEKLTTVDLTGLDKLEELYASMCTNLESMTLGNKPALKEFYGYNNSSLTSLDFSGLTALQKCAIYGAKLATIDIHSTSLTSLNAGSEDLENIDLNGCDNLAVLSLSNCSKISEFAIATFPLLEEFTLTGSQIKSFTTEGCAQLKKLVLDSSTNLTYLNVSKSLKLNTLSCLYCYNLQEAGEVVMTEGQVIASTTGVYDWMITRVPREWPADVAPEISDEAFRNAMMAAADKDGDGKISPEEAQAVTVLNASGLNLTSVDFTYFNNIEELDLSDNQLETIDLSMTTKITNLNLNNNKLTSLNVEQLDQLQYLYANHNEIATISRIGSSAIIEIELADNKISTFTCYYKNNLTRLDISDNEISSAEIRENPKLAYMNVAGNNIKSITMWSLKGLVDVNFSNNPFTQLDEAHNWVLLESIDCSNTDIKTLNLSQNPELKKCVASDCANLETIYLPEGSTAEVVKGDNTSVVFGAPAE